ncbi:hypothetical protein [Microcoleus sp. bin38.metabat.b11b12b14.051]|nr:hypothetical protein [Microcoleus sp. bin38.metabat.b11b12b14.051]
MNASVLLRLENAIGCGTGTGMPAPQSALNSTSAAQLLPNYRHFPANSIY